MRLVNLTPHRLRVIAQDDEVLLDLPACPQPPRSGQEITAVESVQLGGVGLPVHVLRYRGGAELPAEAPGVLLIVPRVLAREVPRADLLFPDEEIRDTHGRIVGCRRLARFVTAGATD